MDSVPCTLADITAALSRGATVLTGNQRAARALRNVHRSQQQAAGLRIAQSPILMPWEAWTASLWLSLLQRGLEERALLSTLQERLLWREIIDGDDSVATLRSADSLAGIAVTAWRLLAQYGGREQLRRAASTSDTEAFSGWADRFERRCRTGQFLSAAELERELRLALEQRRLDTPAEILLVGFEGLTPAQNALIDALGDSGCKIRIALLSHGAVSGIDHRLLVAANEQEELQAAAGWARQILEQHPDAQLAVLVPDLEGERAEIERTLRQTLAPELQQIANQGLAPYEFSLGARLSSSPLIATALDLLRWTIEPLPLERIGDVLLSPYFGPEDAEERSNRTEFDAFALRQEKLLRPQLTLNAVLQLVAKRPGLTGLSRALAAARQTTEDRGFSSSRDRTYTEWMEDVREVLRVASWPGTRSLDSVEFQLRNKWEDVLDQVATLDFLGTRVGFPEALSTLTKALHDTRFAPESHQAPVQVMGVLEAAGSVFDGVWFLRGSDESWPQQARPHPLLPWQLQRNFLMPGIDAARSQQDSRETVARIAASAPTVIFSYAAHRAEGPQHRSPLVAELGWDEDEVAPFLSTQAELPETLEQIEDDVSLPALPPGTIRGGESVLRLQAACGFRAFAERRLWATELDSVTLGMDALQWGILLHDVVRRFWAEVKTQETLRAMPQDQLRAQIDRAIEDSMRRAPRTESSWDAAYLDTLRDRLTSLLFSWMAEELKRKPFAVSLSEEDFEVEVGPLHLKLRMDRIDKVDGGEVLIDYKTGNVGVAGWLGPRPDDPQLPLYAAFAGGEEPLQAMAFARMRAGNEMRLEGYDSGSGMIPKPSKLKTSSLDAQLEEWRAILLRLAEDFADGRADVDPKNYPQTCRYCAQRILCRLNPNALHARDEDEEAESE